MVYNGIVNKCSRLDVIIGLPGSGKSSALTDTISQEFHSRIIDNDDAKKLLPEYNNGWGASVVHDESKIISEMQLKIALIKHENIVLPKVGSDVNKIQSIILKAQKLGYEVNLHYVELPREKALARMINRFLEDGRFLSPKIIDKYNNPVDGNKIENTYEVLKKGGLLNGYSKWNNDVARGENPRLDEWSNCTGSFIDRGRAERATSEDGRNRSGCGCRDRGDKSINGTESGEMGTPYRERDAYAGKRDSISRQDTAYDRAEQSSAGAGINRCKADVEANGFTITNKLLNNYEKLVSENKRDITLREISDKYLSGTENETINDIGQELAQQELQHAEIEASCEGPGG